MIENVVSLFDGKSCGQLALQKAGVEYQNYFASEIDKHGKTVTNHNFPNTKQIGDVVSLKGINLPKTDLLIGGSPCQGFSFAGKELNFNDPRSKLFFEYVRLLNELQPTHFLLENVVMRKEYQDVISSYLGVEPVMINSSLVSAQNRKRLYWANFEITQPADKNISLNDILEPIGMNRQFIDNVSLLNKATIIGRRINEHGKREDYNKNIKITQCLEVRATNRDKSNCLTTVSKDNVLTTMPIGRHIDVYGRKLPYRNYSVKECCRLQTVPENYFDCLKSENQIKKMLGNGWTVDVIVHIFECLKTTYK